MFQLDGYFCDILSVLQRNARVTNSELSSSVGLSDSACLERVRKLEAEGLIHHYRTDIDLDRVCANVRIFAEVTLSRITSDVEARFEQEMEQAEEVVAAYRVSGPFDYVLSIVCRDIQHYHALSERLLESDLGISRFNGNVVLEQTKRFQGYPLNQLSNRNL